MAIRQYATYKLSFSCWKGDVLGEEVYYELVEVRSGQFAAQHAAAKLRKFREGNIFSPSIEIVKSELVQEVIR